jgi:ketosteroid isomerase-like protein
MPPDPGVFSTTVRGRPSASTLGREDRSLQEEDDRMTTDIISPEHPNAASYRRAADAFRAGDLDTLATTIHEDVIWHLPGTSWMARDFEGRATLLDYLREIMVRTNGTFKLQDVFISGCDDHVLAVSRLGATVDSEEQFFDVSSVMRFIDGRQKERWFHLHDLNAFDDFVARF